MPQSKGNEGFQQGFCVGCGAKLRPSTRFCTSCGRLLDQNAQGSGSEHSVPPPTQPGPPSESLRETLQGSSAEQPPNPRSSSSGVTLSGLADGGIKWFKDLPSVPKLILFGLLLLLLLTVLSPIARVVAIIVFVVSAVTLAVRAIQRGPIKGWGMTAVASFVLIFVFGGISSIIYGSGFTSFASADRESSKSSEVGVPEEQYIRAKVEIRLASNDTGNRQLDLLSQCSSYCSQNTRTLISQNSQSLDDLLARAQALEAPEGYEESHDAFASAMQIAVRQASLIEEGAINPDATDVPTLERMTDENNAHNQRWYDLLPPSGRRYFDQHFRTTF